MRKPFHVTGIAVALLLLWCNTQQALAQADTYAWKWKHDGPALAGGAVVMGASWLLRYNADPVTEARLMGINKSDIWSIDRSATENFSQTAKRTSDYFLFGSAALPASLIFSAKARSQTLIIAGMFLLSPGVEGTGPAAINQALVAEDPGLGWDNYFIPGDPIFGSFALIMLLFLAHVPFAMNPHIGKLAFALKDPKQIRTFLLIAIPMGSILGFTVLGGLHARALVGPEIRPDAAIPVLFTELFPPFLAGMLGVGVLSAIMSTSDGLFIAIAVIFSNDLYKRTLAPKIHKHKTEEQIDRIALNISRLSIVVVGVLAIMLAWNPPRFLAILLWIGIGGIVSGAAGPLLIGSLWRRGTKAGAIASFLTGVILYAVLYVVVGWKNPFGVAGTCVIAGSVVMVLVSLFTKPLPDEHLDRMFTSGKTAS